MSEKRYSAASNMLYCLVSTAEHLPALLLWCVLLVGANALIPILTTYLPKMVIDVIESGGGARALITVAASLSLAIALLAGIKKFTEKYISFIKYRMNTYYNRKVAHKGMTTDYQNQEDERFRRFQSESFTACNGHGSPLTEVYDSGISLASGVVGLTVYFGILVSLNPLLILLIIITTSIKFLLNTRVVRWAREGSDEKAGYIQRTSYINGVSSDVRSAKDIRVYSMAGWLEDIYARTTRGLARWYRNYARRISKVAAFDGVMSLLREGISYSYLIYMVVKGNISVADFTLYFGVIAGFSVWLSDILGNLSSLSRISISVNHLRAFLDYPEAYRREGGLVAAADAPKRIEIKNLSYRYEGAGEDVLKNVSLTVAPGEHLAVIGLNGAGKTTLMKLICGLTDPTEGRVLYDGVDIREYDRIGYYRLFSAVFQQFSLLPVTIEEIVSESTEDKADPARVEDCLREAGLWDKISALPRGAKSNYGREIYDDGVAFSGGEVQKLLLARALYRSAPVMILDEPTAALDPISEGRLYERYDALMSGKTALFISHRLASTRFCDRIVLIEGGAICEEGTHESLIARGGRYSELFEAQAKYYREAPDGGEVVI